MDVFIKYVIGKNVSFLNEESNKFLKGKDKYLIELKNNLRLDLISKDIYVNNKDFDLILLSNNIYNFILEEKEFISNGGNEYTFDLENEILRNSIKIDFYVNKKKYSVSDNNGEIKYNMLVTNFSIVDKTKIYIKFLNNLDNNSKINIKYKYYKGFNKYKAGEIIEINDINYTKYIEYKSKINDYI